MFIHTDTHFKTTELSRFRIVYNVLLVYKTYFSIANNTISVVSTALHIAFNCQPIKDLLSRKQLCSIIIIIIIIRPNIPDIRILLFFANIRSI